ncbi:MAG: GIY-YIG nuclease family protein, partial [Sphingopyxis sp.]
VMSFWAYMLHCRGGAFYVGQTDNLEQRMAQHEFGAISGFTADHLPIKLVWSEQFATRDEAKAAEKQLKGWSRAKKMALIRGDWDHISVLAQSKTGPSTGSGQTVLGGGIATVSAYPEPVEGLSLICHPDTPCRILETITVAMEWHDCGWATLVFRVAGHIDQIRFPSQGAGQRSDRLWEQTCFEMFSRNVGYDAYEEVNLSPSTDWASYDFLSYRNGMRNDHPAPDPEITIERSERTFILRANAVLAEGRGPWQIALCAVIEETDGTKSYWALRHPSGPPDFHHPDCFALRVRAC